MQAEDGHVGGSTRNVHDCCEGKWHTAAASRGGWQGDPNTLRAECVVKGWLRCGTRFEREQACAIGSSNWDAARGCWVEAKCVSPVAAGRHFECLCGGSPSVRAGETSRERCESSRDEQLPAGNCARTENLALMSVINSTESEQTVHCRSDYDSGAEGKCAIEELTGTCRAAQNWEHEQRNTPATQGRTHTDGAAAQRDWLDVFIMRRRRGQVNGGGSKSPSGALTSGTSGRRILLFVMLLCALSCESVGVVEDDWGVGTVDNDTQLASGTIHMQMRNLKYPSSIDSGAHAARQTIDDLVFNHFLIHSLGGGGWWSGGRSNKGAGFATVGGEDATCSLHHETIRAANFDHNLSKTHTCAQAASWRLWRSRYLLGDEVYASEDGDTSIRFAKDYQPAAHELPGAMRFIKFVRQRHVFNKEWQRLQDLARLFPDLFAQPIEAFEAEPPDAGRHHVKLSFVMVFEGGVPLSHLITQQDKVKLKFLVA